MGFIFIWFYLSCFSPPSPSRPSDFPSRFQLGLEAGGERSPPCPEQGEWGWGSATSQLLLLLALRGPRGSGSSCPGCQPPAIAAFPWPRAHRGPRSCAQPGPGWQSRQSRGCASRRCLPARLQLGEFGRMIHTRFRLGSCRVSVPGAVPALLCDTRVLRATLLQLAAPPGSTRGAQEQGRGWLESH